MSFQIYNPPYPNVYTLPATSSGGVFAADADDCNGQTGNLNSTATLTNPFDFSIYQTDILNGITTGKHLMLMTLLSLK